MKILFEDENLANYLAKCHEAFRTGLAAMFDTRFFGPGYESYDPCLKDYQGIIDVVFSDSNPDLIIVGFDSEREQINCKFRYEGLKKTKIPVATVLADYWRFAEKPKELALNFAENDISIVLSLFPQPLSIWKDTEIASRLIYIPPSFDPAIFNDWQMPKVYDVGFLAANTIEYNNFYPERYHIHQALLNKKGLKYLWAEHPGWQSHSSSHPLVGKNFSKAINSCKIFITTGGIYKNPQPKIFEALASKTLLMSDEPIAASYLGLRDGFNYVKITTDNVCDKIDFYLDRPDLLNKITENGYQLAIERHSCFARAVDFYKQASPLLRKDKISRQVILLKDRNEIMHMKIDIPEKLLLDENQPDNLRLLSGERIPISSAPQYTIYRLLRHLKPQSVLEIGSQTGASAVVMALAMIDNDMMPDIFCVDPFFPSGDNDGISTFQQWYKVVYGSGFKYGIQLGVGTSSEILPNLNKKFDFVFIDGSHDYLNVKYDCLQALSLLNTGGYFLVHDYIYYDSVKKACDEIVKEFNLPFSINHLQKNSRNETCGWIICRVNDNIDISKYNIQIPVDMLEPLSFTFSSRVLSHLRNMFIRIKYAILRTVNLYID